MTPKIWKTVQKEVTWHTNNCDVSSILLCQSSSSCYSLWTDL